jgi:flagellin
MPVINTNVKALYTQTAMKATERASGVAMQQLSTGKRINSAKDDAAGLAIATRMTQQIRSLNQAMRNAGDAVSLMQTAEGATSEITNMLQRMRELSIQAINDTNADEQRGYLDSEFQQLKQEIVRIADTTEWNGFPILNGTSGERVGERPVYKATSAGTYSSEITYEASDVTANTGTAVLTAGNGTSTYSTLAVTLPQLAAGETVTIDGLAFTATAAMTATQVGAAFASIAAGATTGPSTSLGTYSGALSSNWAAGTNSSGVVTFTAAAFTTVTNTMSSPTVAIASGTATKAGSVTVTVPSATALSATLTAGNGTSTYSRLAVTLPSLAAGKSVTVDGLTFTATAAMTATQVGAAFAGIAAGASGTSSLGTYSGALSANWGGGVNASGVVTFTAAAYTTITNTMSASSADRDATAVMTLPDGTEHTFTGLASGTKVTFTSTPLTNGSGSLVLTTTSGNTASTFDFSVDRTFTPVEAMAANDVIINDVTIGVSYAANDSKSPAGSAAASAIARAYTINENFADTNVAAVVNTNVMTGSAMDTGLSAASGTVTINGYTSAPITTVLNNTRESRAAVVNAINAISFQTGVVAINSNNDNQGVRLEAADGRNIELAFNTTASTSEFEARTGLKEGLQIGSYSLETSVEGELEVTTLSTGDWTRAGLKPASYTTNQAVINTGIRPVVSSSANIKALGDGDLVINGVAIRATVASDDLYSNTTALTSSAAASAIAMANAINSHHAETGVTAKASSVATSGSYTTTALADGTYSVYINGQNVQVAFLTEDSETERLTKVVDAINGSFGQHGAMATNNGTGGITLTTPDGRNLSVWVDSTVDASEFGLAVGASENASGVTSITSATAASTGAATLYGSVSLIADPAPKQPPAGAAPSNGAKPPYISKTFTVEAGVNGFNSETGDFEFLGFQAGTFGGDVSAADSKMTPPRTGRLSFHVGASANQTITIDLSDFGKDGPITGEITGDSDEDPATVHINDRESAKTVLAKLDRAMDKVNGTRATMGAVMNRLEHVIDNLTNVAMNSEASRSQIEDADYAIASTELSRTQIMQQAATAVLAQANTSQQTVLKLLQ